MNQCSSTGVSTSHQRLAYCLCLATAVWLLSGSLASFAAPPIRTYKWAATENPPTTPFVYDSFSQIEGARMPYVIAQLPGGTPKDHPHPGDNCDNNNAYTTQTGVDTGTVCAERRSALSCIIPGVPPPYWITQCNNVVAILQCPSGDATKTPRQDDNIWTSSTTCL